jgi:glutamine synthetase
MGHRPGPKGGYFPVNPVDSAQDLRGEMLAVMGELGMKPEKHHHEVAPAQHELGLKFDTMIVMADRMQLYKYVIHNVAQAYGKTATFMAKPMFGDNGSGMHVHQSIWGDGKPLFAGDKYAGLSDMCLWYIGGIIKHAKAINAFSNSTTNSLQAPGARLRSPGEAGLLGPQPFGLDPHPARRQPRRPSAWKPASPIPMGNPYLTFVALLMAGLDGINNKIDPGARPTRTSTTCPRASRRRSRKSAARLREALENLDKDRAFLKAGGVMDDDFIDSYIELKMEEVMRLQLHPHPVEFDMYYKC